MAYASHVLEHLEQESAMSFLREIHRVLRPGATVRIVVPDLEAAATAYLDALDAVRTTASEDARLRYEWNLILLLDQMVRTVPGGRLASWLRENRATDFVRGLHGIFLQIADAQPRQGSALRRLLAPLIERRNPSRTGELHRWMYDDYSLRDVLRNTGFRDPARMTPATSRVAGWARFGLDLDPDGTPHQPGSLWFEAVR